MSDNELTAKVAVIGAVVIGIIALGYVIIFVIAPIFVVASIIDFGFRQKYNEKLDAIRGSDELDQGPDILCFEARMHEGRIVAGWMANLPNGAQLDIYRLTGSGGGSIDEIAARGTCVLSTGREVTSDRSEVFYDDGLPHGVYYYVPVASGLRIKKDPQPYSFLSFARELQFITRKTRTAIRGEACRVDFVPEEPKALPDTRDDASKLKDEVLEVIKGRKRQDAQLDAAIAKIQQDDDLTEDEKAEAIELMETRAASI